MGGSSPIGVIQAFAKVSRATFRHWLDLRTFQLELTDRRTLAQSACGKQYPAPVCPCPGPTLCRDWSAPPLSPASVSLREERSNTPARRLPRSTSTAPVDLAGLVGKTEAV